MRKRHTQICFPYIKALITLLFRNLPKRSIENLKTSTFPFGTLNQLPKLIKI